jgi:predicted branched-subunit amino acid permease
MPSSNRPVLVLGGLSLATAVAHGAVIDEHLREFAPFGIFFALVAFAELAWATAVVDRPGPQTDAAGVVLNLGLITLWVVSRTLGLPIGPQAGMAEPAGRLDLLCTIAEVAIVVVLSAFPAMPAAGAPPGHAERPAGARLSIGR